MLPVQILCSAAIADKTLEVVERIGFALLGQPSLDLQMFFRLFPDAIA